ncbi:hypothetical protein BN10_360046 [Phycicoccus elongatus Lp2]|uniref:Uncharacterized protein n=1 Tax=Phycicoccus elongatus Lp2 TaxID=1193181 RepID=N0E4C9_9MICO|nr:hypothetical protein BN10_360046 [Phycicoccus elongatus Lp2]
MTGPLGQLGGESAEQVPQAHRAERGGSVAPVPRGDDGCRGPQRRDLGGVVACGGGLRGIPHQEGVVGALDESQGAGGHDDRLSVEDAEEDPGVGRGRPVRAELGDDRGRAAAGLGPDPPDLPIPQARARTAPPGTPLAPVPIDAPDRIDPTAPEEGPRCSRCLAVGRLVLDPDLDRLVESAQHDMGSLRAVMDGVETTCTLSNACSNNAQSSPTPSTRVKSCVTECGPRTTSQLRARSSPSAAPIAGPACHLGPAARRRPRGLREPVDPTPTDTHERAFEAITADPAHHRFYGRLGYAASHEGFKRRL